MQAPSKRPSRHTRSEPARPPATRAAGQVRIIGGQWKRSKLAVADKPGLRPTPDRVRETVFNWLGQDLSGWSCLDAFAGTGALGFEAASRGATAVRLVECDPGLVTNLKEVQAKLGATAVLCKPSGSNSYDLEAKLGTTIQQLVRSAGASAVA